MPEPKNPFNFNFLRSRPFQIVTALLLVQVMMVYGFGKTEKIPPGRPLKDLGKQLGDFVMVQEGVIDEETLKVLQADDTLTRSYGRPGSPSSGNLYVAFFRSQRTGAAPHSPKNCLPGSGWTPTIADIINVPVPGRAPIEVNRYLIEKGESRSLVLYWYQSRDRVVASEYWAKFYVIWDALRYNRTDTALVRVTFPVVNKDVDQAQKEAFALVQSSFGPLSQILPQH